MEVCLRGRIFNDRSIFKDANMLLRQRVIGEAAVQLVACLRGRIFKDVGVLLRQSMFEEDYVHLVASLHGSKFNEVGL